MLQSSKLLAMKNMLLPITVALYSATFALALTFVFTAPVNTTAQQVTVKAQTEATTTTPLVSALR